MRFSYITAVICALGVVKSQLTNNTQPQQGSNSTQNGGSQSNVTIFQILNSTDGSSPARQVAQFLQSSPDYQPIIDILNNPESNVTLFLPNDQVLSEIMGQSNSSSNNGTQGGSSSVTAGPTGSVTTEASAGSTSVPTATAGSLAARYAKIPMVNDEEKINNEDSVERIYVGIDSNFVMRALSSMKIKVMDSFLVRRQLIGNGQNDTSSQNNTSSGQGNSSSQDNSTLSAYTTSPYIAQFSVLDLIYYHIVNQSITLPNSTTQNNTGQSGNNTASQNGTSQISIYQTGPDQNSTTSQNITTYILNTLLTNSTVDRLGYGSPLVIQPSMNNTGNLTIGDGIGAADINSTITASNGIIYIIDKVLVPPVNITDTLTALQNTTIFDVLLASSNVSGDALNNATNITIFVPTNDALQGLVTDNISNDTINSILQAHIFPGIIYSSNITNGTTTATNYAGTNVTFKQSSENGKFSVNDTNIVQPNVLTNSAVMHLIDGVLNYTTPGSSNSTQGNSTESGGAASSSVAATLSASATSTSGSATTSSDNTGGTQTGTGGAFPAPSNTPSSSIISTNVPTLASLFFILTSTCFIFIYYV